jgi:hypothetical protein
MSVTAMSVLCQKQTKCSAAILRLLLDHLVGECQKIHRQLGTRGLCGLEVGELLMCRLLERQISGPRATVDAKFRQLGRDKPPILGRSKSTMEAAAVFPSSTLAKHLPPPRVFAPHHWQNASDFRLAC